MQFGTCQHLDPCANVYRTPGPPPSLWSPIPRLQIPLEGTGKFFYPSGATYEGQWKLLNPPLPPPVEDPKEKKKKPAKDEPPPPPPEPPKRVRHGKGGGGLAALLIDG